MIRMRPPRVRRLVQLYAGLVLFGVSSSMLLLGRTRRRSVGRLPPGPVAPARAGRRDVVDHHRRRGPAAMDPAAATSRVRDPEQRAGGRARDRSHARLRAPGSRPPGPDRGDGRRCRAERDRYRRLHRRRPGARPARRPDDRPGGARPLDPRRSHSIELTVLLTGWLLGGTVGVGTVVYALAIGPLAHTDDPAAADSTRRAGGRYDIGASVNRPHAELTPIWH